MLSLLSGRVFEVDFNDQPLGAVLTQSDTHPLPLVGPTSVQVTSAVQALTVPDHQTLSVSISPDEVADDAGPGAAFATVTRSNIADSADPQIVALSSSHPVVRVPATITIPAGHTSATVPLDVLDIAPFDGLKTVTITASAAAYASIADTLNVRDPFGASPGRLDPTFGDEGKLVTSLGVSGERANSVVLQPDGKIVVAGQLNTDEGSKFALARYHPDGSLDNTFAENGILAISVGTTRYSVANAIAIQSDGKIVVGGSADGDFALARFNHDGSLDAGFDEDGVVTTFGPISGGAYDLAIQPDGKIVAVGYGIVNGTSVFALARYNPDGTLDSTFNGDGRAITHIGSGYPRGQSVALQADGKIVVAGYAYSGSNCSLALARYNPDGSLDATFDGDGTLLTSVGAGYDYGYSVAIQTDGKIVVGGESGGYFAVARYRPEGTLDTDFDGDGKVTVRVGSSSFARSLAIQDDGKIVVAGFTSNGSNRDFAMVRLDPNGALDASFGNQGKLVTAFGSIDDDRAFGLALQSDGRLVAAGFSGSKMALVRYTTAGTLDTSFGGDGKVTTSFGGAGAD